MWRHIKPILQVIVLATTMLVSSLHRAVLENTTKCPVLNLVHTTIPVTRILAHTLDWNFGSFYEVNQKFKHFLLFFSIPCYTKTKRQSKIVPVWVHIPRCANLLYANSFDNDTPKRRYRVCPIIHCCNSTTPYWITAPPILFYMVPCKEGHLCACNILGKHQPLVKRNISFESYEWALFIKVTLFTNGSGCPGTIVIWRCQKVMRTN